MPADGGVPLSLSTSLCSFTCGCCPRRPSCNSRRKGGWLIIGTMSACLLCLRSSIWHTRHSHHLVVVRELAGSRLTRRGTDSEPREACWSMTLEELTETKHSLLELGNNDNVCLLKRDVGPTNMPPRYQNRCVTCLWLGLGLDLVLCTLCNVKYEHRCTNTKIWRINTWTTPEGRSVAQGCWSCWSGRPREKETKRAGAIGASGRNCQTAPRVCICVLRSTSTSRQNPKAGPD